MESCKIRHQPPDQILAVDGNPGPEVEGLTPADLFIRLEGDVATDHVV